MEDSFQISIIHLGKKMAFDGKLLRLGYNHKIHVDVYGIIIFLEKDDEGNYRAVLTNVNDESKIDKDLVKKIVQSFEEILDNPANF